jgi:hypothetical protein
VSIVPFSADSVRDHVAAALSYKERGWPVLPLNGKRPAIKGVVHSASLDDSFIKQRFATGCNVGIQTGKASGIVVVDVDPRNGGDATLSDLITDHGIMPETLQAITGGGGYHLFFNHPGVKLRGKLGDGIDIKSDGGFIVAPPSVHPDTKERYQWRNSYGIADMPQWMLEMLTAPPTAREATSEAIPEGRRNQTLFEIGTAMRQRGKTAQQIMTRLLEDNCLLCQPPLPDEEVHKIAESIAEQLSSKSFKTRWQEAVMNDTGLSMYQRGILMGLSLYMDADGKSCWPAMETMATRFHVGRYALSKAQEAGIERGWLKRYRRPKQKHEPGRQKWSYGYMAITREAV